MENNLQKWFTAAADAEPIVKVEEVGAMINTAPRSVRVKPTFKHFIIMGASLIIITSLVYWMNMPAEEVVKADIEQTTLEQPALPGTKREQQSSGPEQILLKQENSIPTVSRKEVVANEALYIEPTAKIVVEQPQANTIDFQNRIIYLTEKDFEKLDIHFVKNGYNHYYKTYSDKQKIKATQLRSINDSFYFAKGFPGKGYFIKPWESNYHPIFLTDSIGNHQQNFHFQDCPEHQTNRQFTDSLRNSFLRSYNDLLPVAIRTSTTGRLNILWYKPSMELLKQLPQLNTASVSNHQTVNQFHKDDRKIEKGDFVYLSNEELANLGIKTDGNVLLYKNINDSIKRTRYDDTAELCYSTFLIDVEEHGSRRVSMGGIDKDGSVEKNGKSFWPAMVQVINKTDSSIFIAEAFTGRNYEKEFFNETKDLLIPIFISTIAKPSRNSYDLNYIFWFKPEETFFSALPSSIAAELRQVYSQSSMQSYSTILSYYTIFKRNKEFQKGFDSLRIDKLRRNYVTLDEKHLNELNIKTNSKGFTYANRFKQNGKVNDIVVEQEGSYNSYIVNDKLIKPLRIRKKDKPFTAVAVTSPDMFHITYLYVYPDGVPHSKREEDGSARFMREAEELIPVKVNESSVIWFPKSKEVQQIVEQAEARNAEVKETAIGAIHYLELSDVELKQIGITKEGKFLKVPNISNEKHLSYSRYSKSHSEHIFTFKPDSVTKPSSGKGEMTITLHPPGTQPIKVAPSYPKVLYPEPMLITDGTGLHWRLYQNDEAPFTFTDEEMDSIIKNNINPIIDQNLVNARREKGKEALIKRLNTMIAIRVKSDEPYDAKEDANKAVHPDLIIWYNPDSLFLSRLPLALAQQIRDELNHVQSNTTGSACTYFEACANVAGVMSEHILYPNPASDQSSLLLTLGEARTLNIALADISGKVVRSVVKQQVFNEGKHTIDVSVSGLSEGMYLLRVTTDKGEHITQRMVVRNK